MGKSPFTSMQFYEFLICEDEIQAYILRSDFKIVRNFTELAKGVQFHSLSNSVPTEQRNTFLYKYLIILHL